MTIQQLNLPVKKHNKYKLENIKYDYQRSTMGEFIPKYWCLHINYGDKFYLGFYKNYYSGVHGLLSNHRTLRFLDIGYNRLFTPGKITEELHYKK